MNTTKRMLRNLFLGVATCLLLVGVSAVPSLSASLRPLSNPSYPAQMAQSYASVQQHLAMNLQQAEATMVAQGMPASSMQRYVAVMTKGAVVPTMPTTEAFGAAGAMLSGDRLVIRGDFSGLSSGLRDYATDPVSPPNPNITSGVHIHRGEASKNGPFQYALKVDMTGGMSGRFSGEYTLTSEQLQALSNGMLYLDIHTKQNRGGELRGILRPY